MLDAWRASLIRVATSLICVGTIPGAPRPTPKHLRRRAPVEVKQNENPRGSFCPRSRLVAQDHPMNSRSSSTASSHSSTRAAPGRGRVASDSTFVSSKNLKDRVRAAYSRSDRGRGLRRAKARPAEIPRAFRCAKSCSKDTTTAVALPSDGLWTFPKRPLDEFGKPSFRVGERPDPFVRGRHGVSLPMTTMTMVTIPACRGGLPLGPPYTASPNPFTLSRTP